MVEDNGLKTYFRKRINTVISKISTPADESTVETFHRLRVEIKKIRALFSLIEFVNPGFKKKSKKYFEPFKPLFKKAGEVRSLQMEEELMRRYWPHIKMESKTPVAQWLLINQKKQKKAMAIFRKGMGKTITKKIDKTGEKIEARLDGISTRNLIKYNEHAMAELKHLIQFAFTKKETHEVRKQIKKFLYNLKLTTHPDDKVIHQTDHLQDIIGLWHDGEAAVIQLNNIFAGMNQLNKAEEIMLRKIIKKIITENKKLFLQINEEREKLKILLSNHSYEL